MCETTCPSKKPHPHAALIKAWADGAEIQALSPNLVVWETIRTPLWRADRVYRIKPEPKTLKYRAFLWRGFNGAFAVCTTDWAANERENRELGHGFVRWIGDWQTTELPEGS